MMVGKEPYKAEPMGQDRAGEDEMMSTELSVPSASQRSVSVVGWSLAVAIGSLIWIVLYFLLRP